MPETAKYYLARVLKRGRVTTDSLIGSIVDPVSVTQGSYLYTFTNIVRDPQDRFIFANLAKYLPKGEVEVVEPQEHVAKPADVANLQIARSPFVFLPHESAIAFQHVWNKLPRELFASAFSKLVVEKHDGFFADCALEAISDLMTFVQRVSQIDVITSLEATVHPPNPLFSPLWQSLKNYMRTRNAEEFQVKERAASGRGIGSGIADLAKAALSQPKRDALASPEPREAASVTDAAILMAADGYGKAKVAGLRGKTRVVVRTQESQIGFDFPRDPDPSALFESVRGILAKIGRERDLNHE